MTDELTSDRKPTLVLLNGRNNDVSLILEHLSRVERAVNEMQTRAAFIFAMACVERQWPVMVRASGVAPLAEALAVMRAKLDGAWDWLSSDFGVPQAGIEEAARQLIPADISWTEGSATVNLIANGWIDLSSAFMHAEGQYAHYSAAKNLDLINGLSVDASSAIVALPLSAEMSRQARDLAEIAALTGGHERLVKTLRTRSSRENLLGGSWFADGG